MRHIEILGAYGGKSINKSLTSFLVAEKVVIDAGNIIYSLGDRARDIDHIFLSHSHLDHIIDIFFLIDNFYEYRRSPIKIYGLRETLVSIKTHLLNWNIWPDFSEIELLNDSSKSIELIEIELGESYTIDNCTLKPVKTNHTSGSCGYVVSREDCDSIFITADTYLSEDVVNEARRNKYIKNIIIDVSFPSRLDKLAFDSKHLTPRLLKEIVESIGRDDICFYLNHMKPNYEAEIKEEFEGYSKIDRVKFTFDHYIIEL
jgi:ribonuclease BN (tRNA processing enzyme)